MKNQKLIRLISESRQRSVAYENAIMESEKNFRELNSLNMQATLIQIENFLDDNNVYAYKNWIEGEIWDGPNINRYWVDFILRYNYDMMPDPRGSARLINAGAIIKFEEAVELVPKEDAREKDELDPLTRKPKEIEQQMWLIHFRIPRNLIQDAVDDDITDAEPNTDGPADDTPTDDDDDNLELDLDIEDEEL